MSENKKYTIAVKRQRVEVSDAIYCVYYKEREAERYQNKLIRQNELSLERFQEDGVNIDYLIVRVQPDIVGQAHSSGTAGEAVGGSSIIVGGRTLPH